MALFMVLAACYSVLQLAVLSWPARSIGIAASLMAIPVGLYACGIVAFALQFSYTCGVAAVSGESLFEVVKVASYTVDPLIEEVIKVAPLLVLAANVRTRLQWGLTDYVLVGAGVGAGFGLLEALVRFAGSAGSAVAHPAGGWRLRGVQRPPWLNRQPPRPAQQPSRT